MIMTVSRSTAISDRADSYGSSPGALNECTLCGGRDTIVDAGFQTPYKQAGAAPVMLDWFECKACHGCFVRPVPRREQIWRYWNTVEWADPTLEAAISQRKVQSHHKLLLECKRRTERGPLLDVGCNFGAFLVMARDAGWQPVGFEASETAADHARAKGFDVKSGWSLCHSGLPLGHFAAITASDVFYYVAEPLEMLRACHDLLRPGGVLAMRVSNKREWLGAVRKMAAKGARRNALASRLTRGEFHSIGLQSLRRLLREIGFDRVDIKGRAATAPWAELEWKTRFAYMAADFLALMSLGFIRLHPGAYVFCVKARYEDGP